MERLILTLFLVIVLLGCVRVSEEKSDNGLDELQVIACEEAEKSGTCQTRMIEIGIVMPNECCEILGKCCEDE